MSRSHNVQNQQNLPVISILAVLLLSALLTACDGGLFGTGDDGELANTVAIDGIDTESPIDTGNTDSADAVTTPDDNNINTPIDTPPPTPVIVFSNTTPSGIQNSASLLPALKLINLTGSDLNAASNTATQASNQISAPAGETSRFLSINTGESVVTVNTDDGMSALALISPLNAVQDSLTTVIVTTDNAEETNSTTANSNFNIQVLDTRAAVTAAGMSEVRLIFSIPHDQIPEATFTLTPDSNNADGAALAFPFAQREDVSVIGYQMAVPGDYLLSDSRGFLTSQPLQLRPDAVYSIVITDDVQTPVYIEVDSELP